MSIQDNQIREMMSYFNLSHIPFTKEMDSKSLFLLPSIEKAFTQLQLLVSLRGFGVLAGKSGTGKSCLIRLLRDGLSPSSYHTVYVCHSTVSTTEFYSHLASGFGIPAAGRRSLMFRKIKEQIESLHSSKRMYSILVIDEAHLLSTDILQELRLLANFSMDSQNLLTVVLCGQEDLLLKFGLSSLEFLANSISVIVKLQGLAPEESFSYIEKRISESGCSTPLFTKAALNSIHQASGGTMRVINTLALAALLKVFMLKQKQVEAEHVQMVIAR
jgi:type II secretory pathway predicted ATPase ExeA